MELDADPLSVNFADTLSGWFLEVMAHVEKSKDKGLPSPTNDLFASQYHEPDGSEYASREVFRWLKLGSPEVIIRPLSEIRANAQTEIEQTKDGDDEEHVHFLQWAVSTIQLIFARFAGLDNYFVKRPSPHAETGSPPDASFRMVMPITVPRSYRVHHLVRGVPLFAATSTRTTTHNPAITPSPPREEGEPRARDVQHRGHDAVRRVGHAGLLRKRSSRVGSSRSTRGRT